MGRKQCWPSADFLVGLKMVVTGLSGSVGPEVPAGRVPNSSSLSPRAVEILAI